MHHKIIYSGISFCMQDLLTQFHEVCKITDDNLLITFLECTSHITIVPEICLIPSGIHELFQMSGEVRIFLILAVNQLASNNMHEHRVLKKYERI